MGGAEKVYSQFKEKCITPGQMNLIFRARMLWRNTATWIRAYLTNAYAGLDTQAINEKIYASNQEYGNVLKVFFGEKVTDDYINHLNSYITIYQALFQAQMNGDTNAVDEYTKQLYQNIDHRAASLAQINPFWQESELKKLLYPYTDLLLKEAAAFAANDSRKSVDVFDQLLSQSTVIGDYFSDGLINYLNYTAR